VVVNELVREIAQLIESQSGFVIGDQGVGVLEGFVRQRVTRGGFADLGRYADYLRRHPGSEEWRHLLSRITIKESYLFRGKAQFDALSGTLLGEIARCSEDRRLRVWCAGCARGEEAATLAVVLARHPIVGTWKWSVLATDVDEDALADAERGVFSPRAVARVPETVLADAFVRRGESFELDPELRARIEYRPLNLALLPLKLDGEIFDVIFLRNVLIYFRIELQRRVVEGVEMALNPNGSLFLGPSESLLHLGGGGLEARDLGDCFCYRHSAASRTRREPAPAPGSSGAGVVQTTSAGIPDRGTTPMPAATAPSFDARLEAAVSALEIGEIRRAAAGLATLRKENPESALVHALEAIALERLDDAERAVLAYRAALYLAAEMDEIRFLLARALERLGRGKAAAREYRTALSGLGPASGFPSALLGRLGLPGAEEMSEQCRRVLNRNT
jgi:chemotaxis protein methyltransferase CheR